MGTDARRIVATDPNHGLNTLEWSPRGDRLAYSVVTRADGTMATRVADLEGAILSDIPGLWNPRWSPTGGHLSGLRMTPAGAIGDMPTPVVVDLATGAEWTVGPVTHGYEAPAWSPDGASLAFICRSGYFGQPDGTTVIDEARNCHGDGLRVVSIDGSNTRILLPAAPTNGWYFSGPAWSPSGDTIAVTSMQEGDGCRGYLLIDATTGAATSCILPSGMASLMGGGCVGPTMSNAYWTRDSRLVFSVPGAGKGGVFVHDPATGAETFIASMSTQQVSLAPDGFNITYGLGPLIFVGGLDGSNLTLLAEGHSPAWQPLP